MGQFFAIGYVHFKRGTLSMLCRIALWDWVDWVDVMSNCFMGLLSFFLLLAIFRLSGSLGRCCVELRYGTGFFFVFGQKLSA